MKAVIFNSGRGIRMGDMTSDRPKCMVELNDGETVFERQIRILRNCGIREFVITTGPYPEQLKAVAARYRDLSFTFVNNPEYESTNYIVSMYYARKEITDDVLLLHGDLVFNESLICKMLGDERASLCLYHQTKELPDKDFKGRFECRLEDDKLRLFLVDQFNKLIDGNNKTIKANGNKVFCVNANNIILKNLINKLLKFVK